MELKQRSKRMAAHGTRRINRTFMELKLTGKTDRRARMSVSIEPLWNWNQVEAVDPQTRPDVSIEPLWNWNEQTTTLKVGQSSINRTFMELKLRLTVPTRGTSAYQSNLYGIETSSAFDAFLCLCVSIEPLWNWNDSNISRKGIRTRVSIEPLWNWNKNIQDIDNLVRLVSIEPLWNWNQVQGHRRAHRRLRINRTFMELKRGCFGGCLAGLLVSIEPLWNWNQTDGCSCGQMPGYQSNLYGIETI